LLKSLLAVHLHCADRACKLSDAQREKLRLAGTGDLKQFFATVDQAREKFRAAGQDQQKISECYELAEELQTKLKIGVFDESSLYQKVLCQTLDKDQSLRYEQQERERRQFLYEAKIEMTLSSLENRIALRAGQRQRLLRIVLDETKPPQNFGDDRSDLVLFQMAQLNDKKLQAILDDDQWKSLKKLLSRYQQRKIFLFHIIDLPGFMP
jgi:hypothetical protein